MGGRGASSGFSNNGKIYGTEYKTLLSVGNIKFVQRTDNSANAPMETMTKGRVYVTVNKDNELKFISYYDKKNMRNKQIDLTKPHPINGELVVPHVHKGYVHDENGTYKLSPKEKKMVERIISIWYNKYNKQ